MSDSLQSRHCPRRDRGEPVDLIHLKTPCSSDGARVKVTLPSCTAKRVERGYPGSATMVRASIAHLRTTTADGSAPRSRKARAKACSPRALRRLLTHKRDDLDQQEQTRLDQLLNLSPEVQAVQALLQAFLQMVRERKHQDLRSWMKEAIRSGIPELKSFVAGIERDYDAVHAALRLPWRKAGRLQAR
jgi:transposase